MKLSKLFENITILSKSGTTDPEIEALSDNSKIQQTNQLFFAISGQTADGNRYIDEAIANGAVAVVTERQIDCKVPCVVVENVRVSIPLIAANFYQAHKKLKLIGVTGTNGKTSTVMIIKHILETAGKKVGAITTNAVYIGSQMYPPTLTTPDPIKLHSLFADMVAAGCEYAVMEVSAHAIFFNKIYGLSFEVGVFTNLSQDHLDFFKTMEHYTEVKKSFFTPTYCKSCVVNSDDETGRELLQFTSLPIVSYGIKNPADCFAINLAMNLKGSHYVMNLCDDVMKIKTKLCGIFNVYNELAASATCKTLGIDHKTISKALSTISSVDGRFNQIDMGQNFNLIIDYAHTPESLRNLLATVKTLTKQKMVLVFGCPGNRDREKRSMMGEIAGSFCDHVIVTSDNPSYENSEIILREIEQGLKKTNCTYQLIDKRTEAIAKALKMATPKSNLVIAGKGMEDYQDINGMKLPYSDYQTVKEQYTFLHSQSKDQRFVY